MRHRLSPVVHFRDEDDQLGSFVVSAVGQTVQFDFGHDGGQMRLSLNDLDQLKALLTMVGNEASWNDQR